MNDCAHKEVESGLKIDSLNRGRLDFIVKGKLEQLEEKGFTWTASSGMDVYTHAFESIVNPMSNPLATVTALEALKIIHRFLPAAIKNKNDHEAEEQMNYASILAGIASSNAGLGLVHTMSNPLGEMYCLPNGICKALLLPVVEKKNASYAPKKFRLIAAKLGLARAETTDEECCEYVLDKMKAFIEELGMPKNMCDLNIHEIDAEKLACKALENESLSKNPFQLKKEEIADLFLEIQ